MENYATFMFRLLGIIKRKILIPYGQDGTVQFVENLYSRLNKTSTPLLKTKAKSKTNSRLVCFNLCTNFYRSNRYECIDSAIRYRIAWNAK